MSHIRPEVKGGFRRWGDVLAGVVTAGVGIWTMTKGGFMPFIIGLAFVGLGAGWAILGLRRARFDFDLGAPGVVEVDEARIRYLHPKLGGEIGLDDLAELHLTVYRGKRMWRLSGTAGQAMLIPLEAAGAPKLFDTFSALPGLSSAALVAALEGKEPTPAEAATLPPALSFDDRPVWRRPGKAAIARPAEGSGQA